jgi:PBP1b-binding outer membrane lipoprotein LpoB
MTMQWTLFRAALCGLLISGAGCASSGRPIAVRVGTDTTIDLSGKWNDADARRTSDALISDCLSSAWLPVFTAQKNRRPAVRVRGIVNHTDEHIDAEMFIKTIERAMVNSGRVRVLAQEGVELSSMDAEQARAASGRQAADTSVRASSEVGADFVVAVRMASVIDQIEGQHVKLYQVDFELIDPTVGDKIWIGEHKIKKFVYQDGMRW